MRNSALKILILKFRVVHCWNIMLRNKSHTGAYDSNKVNHHDFEFVIFLKLLHMNTTKLVKMFVLIIKDD